MRRFLFVLVMVFLSTTALYAQLKKVYNESIDPIAQIDSAITVAKQSQRHVLCQVGGNWCPWCLKFADFVTKDEEIDKMLRDNYVYIHINYTSLKDKKSRLVAERLQNPGRFGFPVLVILDGKGKILHTQDSAMLEEGESYNQKTVLRFLKNWTPEACSDSWKTQK
ncbi:MAG: thioredoxin family protein [Bacteroidaceae bacterium]|nr:thioredoxin family protein [Bacteroidaceae bacterium]